MGFPVTKSSAEVGIQPTDYRAELTAAAYACSTHKEQKYQKEVELNHPNLK